MRIRPGEGAQSIVSGGRGRRLPRLPEELAVLGLALAIDAIAGEPPNRLHPVVGIGWLIGALVRRAPRGERRQFLYGVSLAAAVPLGSAVSAAAAGGIARRLPGPIRLAALAALLKPAFAIRALAAATEPVERSLGAGDLDAARTDLRALVSRDPAALDEPLVAAAAIESLAENLTDSIVAPLFAFAIAGLPGAYCYRAINTLDSMIGYHGRFEWLGRASARLDDVVNFVPARVAALLLVAAARCGGDPRGAWQAMRGDAAITESPNAGWTMAAMAGALNVRLEKPGHYVLHARAQPPGRAEIRAARRLMLIAAGMAVALAAGTTLVRGRKARG